jgi:hypothetical protein
LLQGRSGFSSGAACSDSAAALFCSGAGGSGISFLREVEIAEDCVACREYVGQRLFRGTIAHGDGKKRETDNQPNGLPNPPHRQKTLCRRHCTMLCQQMLRLVNKCLFNDADKNESAWGVLLVKCCRYQKVVGEQMCNNQGVM